MLNPFTSELPEDYEKTIKEFGIKLIDEKLKKRLPDNYLFRRNIIFAHRDLDKFLDAIEKGEDVAVLTGIKPSNNFHLGSKLVAEQMKIYQSMGAKIFYTVADLEAYHVNKKALSELHEIAVDNVADLLALGIKDSNYFYKQSEEKEVMREGYLYSRNVTYNMMKAIYGEKTIGENMVSLLQVGDILYPQNEKFGGKKHVIVPIGLDQDPHMRLTRDIAFKHKLILPSSTYHKFMRSLSGSEKMSKRDELGMISLSDNEKVIEKKVNRALTGGRDTIQEQKIKGGQPDKCVVFELFAYHFEKDDEKLLERKKACLKGELTCGQCKKELIEKINSFLKQHQEKKEKLKDKAERLLIH